jgi:pheromone shutdown protein TraB
MWVVVRAAATTMALLSPERSLVQLPASRRNFLCSSAAAVGGFIAASSPSPAEAAAELQVKPKAGTAPSCNDAISHLVGNDQDVYLIGTAHISADSAELVRQLIQAVQPDLVCLELDEKRVAKAPTQRTTRPAYFEKGFWREMLDLSTPASRKVSDVGGALVGQAIGNLYKGLDKLGFSSGEEFAVAAREGQLIGARIALIDQDVNITLRRLSEALQVSDWSKLANLDASLSESLAEQVQPSLDPTLSGDALVRQSISAQVELFKKRDTVRKAMAAFKEVVPEVYQALVGERDEYMANQIRASGGKRIVAVCGLAHMDGLERKLGYRKIPCKLLA